MEITTHRYFLTLTKETTDQIKKDLKILRLPPATFSGIIDEQLKTIAPMIHRMAEKKRKGEQVTLEELIEMSVNVMEGNK